MKITEERTIPQPLHQSDLPKKPPRRKTRASVAGIRLKKDSGAPSLKKSSRPETPLLRWKFNDKNNSIEEEVNSSQLKAVVSSRKLAADLWRLHSPESQTGDGGGQRPADVHVGGPIHVHHDVVHSPHSVSGPRNGHLYKFGPSFQIPDSAVEGATKWDPVARITSQELKQIYSQPKFLNQQSVISALEKELDEARARINELESDRKLSKKNLEQFLRKLSEERAEWRRREHEKIRAIIDDMKLDLNREKKNRQRLEIVNSKLINELTDAKSSVKRYAQEYEKERKARVLIEEVCDELAKEIGEDKAEVEALKRELIKLQEEVEEERKMLQVAEVWREERVQVKLVDAKVMLEEKYSQLNMLIEEIESFFMNSSSKTFDLEEVKKAQFLKQVAASINMQDVRDLSYEPPNSDDIYSIFEDINFGGSNEREVSPEVKKPNKDSGHRHSNVYIDKSGELEDDASEWETVSHLEDQGSSYSPEGSDKNFQVRGVSRSGDEETHIMEISEVGSDKKHEAKRVSSVSRLWKTSNGENCKMVSVEGINGRLSNGRLSNGAITMSPNRPQDLGGQWNSPDLKNPHINRGAKGCIEWPRGTVKSSLKARLLEARMENQKIQLRQVLKHKI
ncbi:hypothetical protein ACJIZ3_013095 [Penstemon smallii]|uniref:Uncharacterized protein n=1 Tax=Penstemon smallii TaxID=265156 RepID=A0ABD3URT2_9LAMI